MGNRLRLPVQSHSLHPRTRASYPGELTSLVRLPMPPPHGCYADAYPVDRAACRVATSCPSACSSRSHALRAMSKSRCRAALSTSNA